MTQGSPITHWIIVTDLGALDVVAAEPPRAEPHTTLGTVTINGTLVTIEDLRPHKVVGAHNDTSDELVATDTQTTNYAGQAFDLVIADTSGGAWILEMPTNPVNGDRFGFYDLTGSFATNPLVLRIPATEGYTISDSSDDWLFSAPYTYIELIFVDSEGQNTWAFKSIPDTTCKNRGVFIKCGGAEPDLTNSTACTNAGFDWNAAVGACFRFNHMGVYSDGNGGNVILHHDARCATNLDEELEGRFLRCDGTSAVYDAGSTGDVLDTLRVENIVENAPRCGGTKLGLFKECRLNADILQTGQLIYDGIYENNDGTGEIIVEGDNRCIETTINDEAKQGNFVQCLPPGAVTFGDTSVNVGVYTTDTAGGYNYFFDDPKCRDITVSDYGRFVKCDGNDGIYQTSGDGSSYRTVAFDERCYDASETGRITMFLNEASQIGPWLKCDGGAFSTALYPALDALLTSLGFSSGSKPDFRNRSPFGLVGAYDATLGTVFQGSNDLVLLEDNLPPHNHGATAAPHSHVLTMDPHDHTIPLTEHFHSINLGTHNHQVDINDHVHQFDATHDHNTLGGGSHQHSVSVGAHVHDVVPFQHRHGVGGHTHGMPQHQHNLYVWYDVDGNPTDDEVDALNYTGAGGDPGIAGESRPNTLNSSYQFANAAGNALVAPSPLQNTFIRNTTGTSDDYTDGVTEVNPPFAFPPTYQTQLAGNFVQNTTFSGVISDLAIDTTIINQPTAAAGAASVISENATLTGNTGNANTGINATGNEVTTGTIDSTVVGISISNTGSGLPISLIHQVFNVSYYIHV